MRIIGTIEARMGSTRLPCKTMMVIYGNKPLLECVVRRFRLCREIDNIVVATTVEKNDNVIAKWCAENNVPVFRGSEKDVLGRVVGAAAQYDADAVVQMGADSAYLDFQLIDELVKIFKSNQYDYVCNDLEQTYPLGIYGHVVRHSLLQEIRCQSDLNQQDQSDVVRYIWERPQNYKIFNLKAPPELRRPDLRLTIDYLCDLYQAREVYRRFQERDFTSQELIAFAKRNPEIFRKTKGLIQQSAPFKKNL